MNMALKNSIVQRQVNQLMLDRVTIKNFRSIKNSTVSVKPLTIVVGGNSAGKSSLLKALLLLVQGQREKFAPGEVALNGSFVRLEQFGSVVNGGNLGNRITIGLHFTSRQETEATQLAAAKRPILNRRVVGPFGFSRFSPVHELYYEVDLKQSERSSGIGAVVRSVLSADDQSVEIEAREAGQTTRSVLGPPDVLPFHGKFQGISELETDPSGVTFSGAVLQECWIERSLIDVVFEEILNRLEQQLRMPMNTRNRKMVDSISDSFAIDFLNRLAMEVEGSKVDTDLKDPEIILERVLATLMRDQLRSDGFSEFMGLVQSGVGLKQVTSAIARNVRLAFDQILDVILEEDMSSSKLYKRVPNYLAKYKANRTPLGIAISGLRNSFADSPPESWINSQESGWDNPTLIPSIQQVEGGAELDAYLSRSVSYLGPLRTAPSSAIGYSMRGTGLGVGPDGGQLAYLLVTNPSVQAFRCVEDNSMLKVENTEMKLVNALSYWVEKLGLAESVSAREVPGVGDAIKLGISGVSGELSPSDVGVGVSQALPVIAAVLLANPGDLIILEQPELHLHPDAQLELAKFFVAAMRSGRQLLIESHSEHFLNKLRLLTAQASDAEAEILISSIGFLFAERDKKNGLTEFREVELSRDGSIQDWPKGFFDQGSSAARELFLLNRQRTNS